MVDLNRCGRELGLKSAKKVWRPTATRTPTAKIGAMVYQKTGLLKPHH
jgi:hypothetical protein